jgi:H+/Cl- antiporter ClcA/CBS domain-containing protein
VDGEGVSPGWHPETAHRHEPDRLGDFSARPRLLLISVIALVIGCISAVVAKLLLYLIALITNISYFGSFSAVSRVPDPHRLGIASIFIPAIGGLITGLMARYGSEKIRGHGIPEALEAILIGRSRISPKVAILKPVSSAISIGTGGPFGAEGPIIMTGGAFGSLFAQFFHLAPAERKTLLVAGAAAGMAAIFGTPVAAILLAVELLLFEWKPRSWIPVAIAALVGGAVRVPLLGTGPLFPVPTHAAASLPTLALACLFGVVAGLGSSLMTVLVYAVEDLFRKLPFHWMWWPVLGGLAVGIGGWIDPRVLGVGYGNIDAELLGKMAFGALVLLLVTKTIVWVVALGSGTSGGVLAPLLMLGGALGAVLAHLLGLHDVGFWAAVGMSAIMSGTMRAPFTAAIFLLELTHDLGALPAVFAAGVFACIVTVLVMKRSILTEKVARRGYHITREYSVDPFDLQRVGEAMDVDAQTLLATTTVDDLAHRLSERDPSVTRHHAVALVDQKGRLAGIITRGDVLRALERPEGQDLSVLQAGTSPAVTVYPDQLIQDAASLMLHHRIGRVLVVERDDPTRVVGYLGRPGILEARLHRHHEETLREPGLIDKIRNRALVGAAVGGEDDEN